MLTPCLPSLTKIEAILGFSLSALSHINPSIESMAPPLKYNRNPTSSQPAPVIILVQATTNTSCPASTLTKTVSNNLPSSLAHLWPQFLKYSEVSVAQLCPSLCDPMDCSPPGTFVYGDSPGKNTGVGYAPGHIHRGNQNWKSHVYPNVHHSTVYNSQDMEAT